MPEGRWNLGYCAPNRARLADLVKGSSAPAAAKEHAIAILRGEDYSRAGVRNPDGPLRLIASGEVYGNLLFMDEFRLEYAPSSAIWPAVPALA